MTIALIVVGSLLTYIALGVLATGLIIRYDKYTKKSVNDGDLAMVAFWPIVLPVAILAAGGPLLRRAILFVAVRKEPETEIPKTTARKAK